MALRPEDAQEGAHVGRPVGLPLMVQTALVEGNVEGGIGEGQREDIRAAEGDPLDAPRAGELAGALQRQGFVVDGGDAEAEPRGREGVASLAAAAEQGMPLSYTPSGRRCIRACQKPRPSPRSSTMSSISKCGTKRPRISPAVKHRR